MTGTEVTKIRKSLGMSVTLFSQLFGVSFTTVYRWEKCKEKPIKAEALGQRLLAFLQQVLSTRLGKSQQWAKQLRDSIMVGGTLSGLAFLLQELPSAHPLR